MEVRDPSALHARFDTPPACQLVVVLPVHSEQHAAPKGAGGA